MCRPTLRLRQINYNPPRGLQLVQVVQHCLSSEVFGLCDVVLVFLHLLRNGVLVLKKRCDPVRCALLKPSSDSDSTPSLLGTGVRNAG